MSEKIISIPFLNTFVQQSTESTMVNIKSIVDIVNQKRLTQGKQEIRVDEYLNSNDSIEYVNTVVDVLGIEKHLSKFEEMLFDTQVEVIEETKFTMSDLKELGLYKLTKGKNAGIWFHPLLAIDIVGWMDAEIRCHFNSIVAIELFRGREDVSKGIRDLTDLINKTWGKQESQIYMQLNMVINKKIYGVHFKEIRDIADGENYEKMKLLFTKLTFYIEEDIIHSTSELYETIRKVKI